MNTNLNGKIAIVTGAARGIGRAISEKLIAEGATVVLSDILREQGEETAGPRARCHLRPLRHQRPRQVASLIDATVERFGRLDVMVNNAGINTGLDRERVNIDQFLDETWHRILNVDLTGTFYCCRAAAAQMVKQQSGSIVNISSVAGVVALRLQIAFVAAKAAIINLTEAMACEIGPQGVRVNAISPGSIDVTPGRLSEVPEEQGGYADRAKSIASFIPQRRLGRPSEIADAVVFLASDAASLCERPQPRRRRRLDLRLQSGLVDRLILAMPLRVGAMGGLRCTHSRATSCSSPPRSVASASMAAPRLVGSRQIVAAVAAPSTSALICSQRSLRAAPPAQRIAGGVVPPQTAATCSHSATATASMMQRTAWPVVCCGVSPAKTSSGSLSPADVLSRKPPAPGSINMSNRNTNSREPMARG